MKEHQVGSWKVKAPWDDGLPHTYLFPWDDDDDDDDNNNKLFGFSVSWSSVYVGSHIMAHCNLVVVEDTLS